MFCKYCNTPIPSKKYICPACGRMASMEQIQELKRFNKNSGWDTYSNINTSMYKSNQHKKESNKGLLLVLIIVLVVCIISIIKVLWK